MLKISRRLCGSVPYWCAQLETRHRRRARTAPASIVTAARRPSALIGGYESKVREAIMMKRVIICVVGIGALASLGMLTEKKGFDAERCKSATLKGRYLFAGLRKQYPPNYGFTLMLV